MTLPAYKDPKSEFRRMAIRLLNGQPIDQTGSQRLLVDRMELIFRKEIEGLMAWVETRSGGGAIIWNDATGGCQISVQELTPFLENLRRMFVLDELSEI